MRPDHRHSRFIVSLASLAALIGCSQSSTTAPPDVCIPVAGGISGGHPAGIIDSIYPLSGRPFGVAINSVGTILIGRQDLNDFVRGSVSNFVFSTSSPAGNDPGTIAMNPSGAAAAISNYNDFTVGVIDVSTNAMFTTVGVGSNPFQVKFHPDDTKLYVGTATTGVHVINTSLTSITIPAPDDENGMAFSPSACKLYVSALDQGQITEIDTHADTVLRTITIGGTPQELAVSPDSTELWVADEGVGVKIYTLPSLTYSATVPGTAGAWGLAMSPDGQQLYATLPEPGTIKIISRTGRNVVGTLTAGKPRRVAFDFAGAHVVVADEILGAILIR